MIPSILPSGFIFSQSSIQDYADCPLRFKLRYLDKLVWPAVENEPIHETERHQKDGRQFHRMMQQFILGIPADIISQQAFSADVQRWWDNFQSHPIALDGFELHTELTLSAPLEGTFRVVAKYDLVAIQAGKQALIFDWKTYSKRPRDEVMASKWQTRIYRTLLVQAGANINGGKQFQPEQILTSYWYAEYPSKPAQFAYSSLQYDRDRNALDTIINEIASAKEFPKTEEEMKCTFCVYRSFCDRKVNPGRNHFLESELESPGFNLDQIEEIAF